MRENGTRSNPAARAAKALAVLALCLLAPAAARAQWTQPTPPETNISNTNAGNVGVGTSAPNFKLEVSGSTSRNTVGVTGNGDSVGYAGIRIQAQNTAGIASNRASAYVLSMRKDSWYSGDASGPSFIIETNSPTGGFAAPFMITPQNHVILNGGRGNGGGLSYGWVGVGTTTPAANLHVNNAGGFGAVRVSGAGGGLMQFYDASAPADRKLYQWRSEGGVLRMALANDAESAWVQQNILVANSSGNVGLGTASPAARLHVQGGNVFHQYSATPGQEYGFYTAVNNNHFTSNLGFDGQWKMIAAGKGAIANVAPASGFAFMVGADNVSRAAGGLASITQYFTVMMDGSVGVGTQAPAGKLDVNAGSNTAVAIRATGAISATGAITGATVSATYQDVAEWVASSQKLAPGTVVVLDAGRTNQVVASAAAYDTKVAGVVSEQPGLILGVGGEGRLKVATTGRVKVKVDATRGAIHVGDLLVTSGVEGAAMKSTPVDLGGVSIHRPGTIIGKALEPLESGTGEILVLLSLQ